MDKLPPEIKTIVDNAKAIAGVYSGISGTIDAAVVIAQMLGILEKFDQAEEFRRLHEHLDQLGAALDWKLNVDNQDRRLAKVLATVYTAEQAVKLGMPFNLATDGVSGSLDAVIEAGSESQFKRYYVEYATGQEGWSNRKARSWKAYIKDRPEIINNYVYDWRLGVPALMQLVSLRLIIIAAIDPNFKNDMIFRNELLKHRTALLSQYKKMIDGIRCNQFYDYDQYHQYDAPIEYSNYFTVACADIYTGTSVISDRFLWSISYGHYDIPGGRDPYWQQFVNTTLKPTEEALYRQVLLKMPLFEMRSMIDTLYLYANGGPDLTKAMEFIQVAAAPNLCLDVQWGNPTPGTPVHIWDCDGGGFAQHWVYDRQSGTIRNPVYDKCLDVQWGNPAPGTPVQIWDCNGGLAQKWTWDPDRKVLQNAVGTVLDIQWGALQAQTPVWTWGRNEGPAQQWTSPPFDPAVLEDGLLDQVDAPLHKGEWPRIGE